MSRVCRIKYTSDNLKSDSESETNDKKMSPARRSKRPRAIKHSEILSDAESEEKSPFHPKSVRINEKSGKDAESSKIKRKSVKFDDGNKEDTSEESEHENTVTGPKKLTQSATVAVIKLKIPELNGSSEVNKSAGKETPSRSLRERKTVSPQNENGNISTSEDETDDGVIVRRQGKTRTVKQRAGSEEFRKISANGKSGLRERKPSQNNSDIDSDNIGNKRRKSDRIKTPTQRKYIEIDSDSDDETKKTPKRGNAKKSGNRRSLSPDLSDSVKSDIYLSDSSLSDEGNHTKGRMKQVQNRRKVGRPQKYEKSITSSRSKDPYVTSLVTGKNEELQRIYLAKQIEMLDHDLYLKKLEMLQKEKALKLPASTFTIALVNKQGE